MFVEFFILATDIFDIYSLLSSPGDPEESRFGVLDPEVGEVGRFGIRRDLLPIPSLRLPACEPREKRPSLQGCGVSVITSPHRAGAEAQREDKRREAPSLGLGDG